MKRKLFTILFLLAVGGEVLPSLGYQPQLFDRAMARWNAPPAPPSPEAQRLIASLESGEGWTLAQEESSRDGELRIRKGDMLIHPGWVWASVHVGGVRANCSFSVPELREINGSAEKCIRRLTAEALEARK